MRIDLSVATFLLSLFVTSHQRLFIDSRLCHYDVDSTTE